MASQTYELVVLFSPELNDHDFHQHQDTLVSMINRYDGKIVSTDVWGKKVLAYPIQKFTEANYVFYEVTLDRSKVAEVDKELRLNENVMRYLLVTQEKKQEKGNQAKKAKESTEAAA